MSSTRLQKVARLLKEELSLIIRKEMNDPRLGFISITDVELTTDLHVANIYISTYGTPEETQASMDVLTHAAGFLRGEISRHIDIRYTPELRFHRDISLERGARVTELLKDIAPTLPKENTDDK